MSDIVERLRSPEVLITNGLLISPVAYEGAAEIEKLEAENERLRAENERFRTALRNAYEVYAGSDGFIPETAAEGYLQQIIKQMVDCISAALEVKP
jgi:hypothetical protein